MSKKTHTKSGNEYRENFLLERDARLNFGIQTGQGLKFVPMILVCLVTNDRTIGFVNDICGILQSYFFLVIPISCAQCQYTGDFDFVFYSLFY